MSFRPILVLDRFRNWPEFNRSAKLFRRTSDPVFPLGDRIAPFFFTIDGRKGRLAEVVVRGLACGEADGRFVRVKPPETVPFLERILEKMSLRVLGLNGVDPALRGSERLVGLVAEVSGFGLGRVWIGRTDLWLRMARLELELEAGKRMPDEVRGLGAVGLLARLGFRRVVGFLDVRAGDEVRPERREEVEGRGRREEVLEVPLRLEPLEVATGFGALAVDRLVDRAGDEVVPRVVEPRLMELRVEEPRVEVVGDEERARTRDVVLERLVVRGARDAEGALDGRLVDERLPEDLVGRSLAWTIGEPTNSDTQATYVATAADRKCQLREVLVSSELWRVMGASFRRVMALLDSYQSAISAYSVPKQLLREVMTRRGSVTDLLTMVYNIPSLRNGMLSKVTFC